MLGLGTLRCRWQHALCGAAAVTVLAAEALPPSPFGLQVETVAVTAQCAVVRIAVSLPADHVVCADTFKVRGVAGASAESEGIPTAVLKADPSDPQKQVAVYAHSFESQWRISPSRDGAQMTVAYQGCSDKVCFMPEEHLFRFDAKLKRFVAAEAESGPGPSPSAGDAWIQGLEPVTSGGYLSAKDFLAFLDRANGGQQPTDTSGAGLGSFLSDPVAFFRGHGLVLTLLLVLIGGVLLNLTPCVLPMIPINLAIIGAGAGTRGRGFLLGSCYGAGMVLVYGGLGWAILRSGLFFGALQASPWFSLTVAVVFSALALAMFDVWVVDFARFAPSRSDANATGGWAAFFAGALSALLAGACVAPVVLAVLLLAGTLYAGGNAAAQFLPFVLGLGMALPWPFAGAGLSVLPQPGLWMVRVKQVFGVFLALLALYYFHLAAVGFLPASASAREGSIAAGDRAAWTAKVEQARREGKPILVDFWATWCKNCSAMERTTFRDSRVQARLSNYVVVKVQAEKPDQEPARAMLEAFAVRGLPAFVVLKP